jgi:hypothetical protein
MINDAAERFWNPERFIENIRVGIQIGSIPGFKAAIDNLALGMLGGNDEQREK